MKKILFSLAAFMLMTTACTTQQQTTGIDLANLDTTVAPGTDFYRFATGGWTDSHPLTAEYARFSSFDQLAENNKVQLRELIENTAESLCSEPP